MSKKVTTAKSLANKLSGKTRLGKIAEVQDIEDSVKFFSPVQTRHQRKINYKQIKKIEPGTDISENSLSAKSGTEKKQNPTVSQKLATNPPIQVKDEKIKDGMKVTSHIKAEDETIKKEANGWQPKDWRVVLDNIRTMRAGSDAPVDTMGCHKCADNDSDEKTQRFQKLVSLMLSSQTKDEITFEAMQRLRSIKMTPQVIADMERNKLEDMLKPVSFYKNKAKYMQLAARILIDKYQSDIPSTVKELESLPGVGPKMAHICMATAWNEVTGIGVDVHVHRITNRLKWLPKPTKEPEQTRIALEAWLPRDMWREVNHLLVGFGQTTCKALRPQCMECLNRYICPASEYKGSVKNKNLAISKDVTITKKLKST
ncbi:endonuclease III-like protein 1 [Eurosta solidaginis]|uniref:endonuclease III-like protein 1 n=1 Tax=Eurosta solidaginis TaxID=178769 RepID=UPI0035312133